MREQEKDTVRSQGKRPGDRWKQGDRESHRQRETESKRGRVKSMCCTSLSFVHTQTRHDTHVDAIEAGQTPCLLFPAGSHSPGSLDDGALLLSWDGGGVLLFSWDGGGVLLISWVST